MGRHVRCKPRPSKWSVHLLTKHPSYSSISYSITKIKLGKKIRNSKLLGISELVRNIVWSPTLRFHNERKKSNMEICIHSCKSSIFTNENQINYIRSGKKITWWSHDVAVTNAFWARKRIILFVRRFRVWNPENAIISCRLPLFLLPTS